MFAPRPAGISVPRRMSEPFVVVAVTGGVGRPPIDALAFISAAIRSFDEALLPFTKRCSAASYAMPIPRDAVAAEIPTFDWPAAIDLATRAGADTLSTAVGSTSREVFLKFFHLSDSDT